MSKHTPGHWHANAIAKGRILGDENATGAEKIQIHANTSTVATVYRNSTVATVYRAADATLIKAAPALAEALRECVDCLAAYQEQYDPDGTDETTELRIQRARAALKLAGLE